MVSDALERIEIEDLAFDLRNPRLPEFDLGEDAAEEDVIALLWASMDVRELVLSIAASGFFDHEPLIVAREGGQNIVIEGNRRLAAVKLLADPDLAASLGIDLPSVAAEERAALRSVPAVRESRRDAWRYLGFKHVNGPAKWSSFAKSRYIAEVHREYGVELNEIAKQIGDTHQTVQRLYRGLMVIEQAERRCVFDREDRWKRHFSFSHLYTGLDYEGVSSFIDLTPASAEDEEPVPGKRVAELGELCAWLYGSKKSERRPVVQSQNPHLRQLNAALKSREGLAALRRGESLEVAFEASQPSASRFEESLLRARHELQRARGLLTVGYDGSEELLGVAGTTANLADDLYDEMRRKSTSGRQARVTESE